MRAFPGPLSGSSVFVVAANPRSCSRCRYWRLQTSCFVLSGASVSRAWMDVSPVLQCDPTKTVFFFFWRCNASMIITTLALLPCFDRDGVSILVNGLCELASHRVVLLFHLVKPKKKSCFFRSNVKMDVSTVLHLLLFEFGALMLQ